LKYLTSRINQNTTMKVEGEKKIKRNFHGRNE